MKVILEHERAALLAGDCGELDLPPNSIDAIVTDPPCGIGFMNKEWDGDRGGAAAWSAWLAGALAPAVRALKPGGHALVWAIPRTSHWTAAALELAGLEIRDVHHDICSIDEALAAFAAALDDVQRAALARILESQSSPILYHLFGTGFPKSLNLSKAIDDRLGVNRVPAGRGTVSCQYLDRGEPCRGHGDETSQSSSTIHTLPTSAGSATAAQWEGWGTALKPAVEHWILARKPLAGTYVGNVMRYGVGGLNIDACRVGTDDTRASTGNRPDNGWGMAQGIIAGSACGRWPAHLTLDETTAAALDAQAGDTGCHGGDITEGSGAIGFKGDSRGRGRAAPKSSGGASRFFYVAKAARSEKDAGLDHLPKKSGGEATGRAEGSAGTKNARAGAGRTGGARNFHPTVKNLALMRWLIQLVTPPGGTILDPFAGSGTTGVAALELGCNFVGCEQGGKDGEYLPILVGRIAHALGLPPTS